MAEATYPSASSAGEDQSRTQALNQRFGEFKKFVSTNFTRTKQFTLEKVGRADSVTAYDDEYDELSRNLDQIKQSTERILNYVEGLVQRNPGIRFEDVMYTKLNRPKPHHSSPHELLGGELARAGNLFGSETPYGSYLIRCSEVESKLGQSEQRFQDKARTEFMTPLHAFLEIDVKNIMEAKRVLGVKRLDLDACRTRAKRAQEGEKMHTAETELRATQADYDMQLEKVRSSMKKIVDSHVNHLGHLQTLMRAQRMYYTECVAHLAAVAGGEVTSFGGGESEGAVVGFTAYTDSSGSKGGSTKFTVQGIELDREDSRKAKVLYDYDAEKENELTVFTDQMVTVTPIPDDSGDFMMAERDGQFGKIPSTYIELL